MDQRRLRVYVGSLPHDTVEHDIKNIMKKYATVTSVEIKSKPDGLFAFVDLECLKTDNYLHQLSKEKLRGQQLRVQLARESFLQRLARERLENHNVSVKNKNVSPDTPQKVNCLNKCIVLDTHNIGKNMNKNSLKKNANGNFISTDSENSSNESSDTETPTKGCLQMFQGTKSFLQDEVGNPLQQKSFKVDSNKISVNKICEEEEILEKFEMFNSVWKDEPFDILANTLKHETESRSEKHKLRQVNINALHGNVEVEEHITEPLNAQTHENISQIKYEAEKRRVKAISDRQKEILNRRNVIQFALASVDSNNTSRPNKKVLFTDDDYEEGITNYSSPTEDQKLTLFEDYEEERDEDDFRIRNHFEGQKGQALLSLQARYANDKRFILDERFIESDDSKQERENKVGSDDTQAERLKLLSILGNVLGTEISNTDKLKSKCSSKLMLRYDPTKPDHTKFEIKQDSSVQNSKNRKKKMKAIENNGIEHTVSVSEVKHPKEVTDNLPVVSKERYYQVSETLQETLQSNDKKFSLLEIFGDEIKNEKDTDMNSEAKLIINEKKSSPNLFKDDSSSSEDDINEQNKSAGHYGDNMKHANLFFDKNDARFIEGLEFIRCRNEEYVKNFNEIRNNMKSIVKHKLQNHRRNAGKRKTKLGGRMGNLSSGKLLKINFRR